jgi:hypothetical protein
MIGSKVMEQLKSGWRSRKAGTKPPAPASRKSLTLDPTLEQDADAWVFSAALDNVRREQPQAVLLGICEDGLPLTLELEYPSSGSVLILGDAHSGKNRLLQTILASTAALHEPEKVIFHLVAAQPEACAHIEKFANCQANLSMESSETPDLIHQLVDTLQERRRDRSKGAAILLAIEDLAGLMSRLDSNTQADLFRILRHGPRTRLWTLATLDADQAAALDSHFLYAFSTFLYGRIADRVLAAQLSDDLRPLPVELQGKNQFCVAFGNQWIRFWIPKAE